MSAASPIAGRVLRTATAAWTGGTLAVALLALLGDAARPLLLFGLTGLLTVLCAGSAALLRPFPARGVPVQGVPVQGVPGRGVPVQAPPAAEPWYVAAAAERPARIPRDRPTGPAGPPRPDGSIRPDSSMQPDSTVPAARPWSGVSAPARTSPAYGRRVVRRDGRPDAGEGTVHTVQCPRCGSFLVDRTAAGFGCAACGLDWGPDAGARPTVVRPRLWNHPR